MALREIKDVSDFKQHYFIDDQGRKQGRYIVYHDNGNIWEESNYVDDRRYGARKVYFRDGHLEFFIFDDEFSDDVHGEFKLWNKDCTVSTHVIYRHRKEIKLTTDQQNELNDIDSLEKLMMMTLKYGVPLLLKSPGYEYANN